MPETGTQTTILSYQERVNRSRKDPFFISRSVERVVTSMGALCTSQRWLEVREILDTHLVSSSPITEMVCYCLGDIEQCGVPYQLAFFLLLANHLKVPAERRLVFDPVHGEKDRQMLRMVGCTPVTQNEHGKRQVMRPVHVFCKDSLVSVRPPIYLPFTSRLPPIYLPFTSHLPPVSASIGDL